MSITINFAKDRYSLYGLRSFLIKYGIDLTSTDQRSQIRFVSFNHNRISLKNITGWIELGNERLPVFRAPLDLADEGDALLTYSGGNRKYPCAVTAGEDIIIGLDIFGHIGYSLSGYLEKIWMHIGGEKNGIVNIPFADYYGEILFNSLLNAHKRSNLPLVHKAFWPDGKRFAVCLTHDVDEIKKLYQWITYPLRFAARYDLRGIYNQSSSFIHKIRGKEPYWTFERIMELESKLGVRSSFFFLNETGKVKLLDKKTWRHSGRRYSFNDPKVASMIKELHSKGWDVGLHGSFYSHNDFEKIQKEKEALEGALGSEVHGIRQHNLNLSIPQTWLHQERAGLEYDTTLGFNNCIGFRWGTCFPFRPFYAHEDRALSILEIPLVIEDLPFYRYKNPCVEGLKVLGEVERSGGVGTLLWHHSVFNDYEFPGWSAHYEKMIEYCKKKNAWVTSAREISRWWIWREKTSFEWDYEGTCLRIIPYPKEKNHFLNVYPPEKMIVKKISNARVTGTNGDLFSIRTDSLRNNECVEIEFTEWNHGN
ncbi:hypothetical protein ANME2D_01267 [Candidatus Methanoperedens nitroreducens]|uniref:NodB homology domain-containing protein n=1 Tax=Candidatus Methanoperedens nitratireducens TaxID=1392998 RepID=A0A062V695_9EURY|nr:polysaccharide deacetylase family protein [Candidatus Methanoperedens nitroreducens]KCZ72832.1 hypothetical protein ANME2D_01267 [Candidatus Methanoperedens nitroreducens]MDJ1423237.1 polysaccharide deacetylase family protein [Candidatus Methanoperedens sp.]